MKLIRQTGRTLIIIIAPLIFSFGCVNTSTPESSSVPSTEKIDKIKEVADTEVSKAERFIVSGWVINTHTEYFHTVVGLRTEDNQLLNLIFPGIFMQFGQGMHYRITYYRINDTNYLPELLRNQRANYFYLDNVELLDDNVGVNVKKEGKR